jgi:hypothetical protein
VSWTYSKRKTRYLYDIFISEAEKNKAKGKKNLTISKDNANAKANALKDYSLKYCKKIAKTSIACSRYAVINKGRVLGRCFDRNKKWSN